MTKNILAEIYQHKLIEVREAKKIMRLEEICKKLKCSTNKPKDFIAAIKNKINQGKNALICEVKKASPSRGIIRENFKSDLLFNGAFWKNIFNRYIIRCIIRKIFR